MPDITGTTSSHVGNNVYLWDNTDGAFYSDEIIDAYDPVFDDKIIRTKTKKIRFSASRSNIIYGRSNTVQPHSIRCFIWQRTK